MTPFGRLDRYLLRRALLILAGATLLVAVLMVGFDLLLRLKVLLRGVLPPGTSRWGLIAELYLTQLPTFLSPVLPALCCLAALLVTAPMLKRGEFTALSANGVAPGRSCRALLLLALGVGVIDVFLADQVIPRLEGRREALEDMLGGETRSGRSWRVDETGTAWFADTVILRHDGPPILRALTIAPADGSGGLLTARSASVRDGLWWLEGPIARSYHAADGTLCVDTPTTLACTGTLFLPTGGSALDRLVVDRYALTSAALLERGGHAQLSLVAERLSHVVRPLVLLLLLLPLFVRFANRGRLLVAGVQALAAGGCGQVVLSTLMIAADASSLPPLLLLVLAVVICLAPGIWQWWRWRL
jgi:lipopolysaccharide export LptBFGC system permease protein LptF